MRADQAVGKAGPLAEVGERDGEWQRLGPFKAHPCERLALAIKIAPKKGTRDYCLSP